MRALAILAKSVRVGDVIGIEGNISLKVATIFKDEEEETVLFNGCIRCSTETLFPLLGRPWPEGKTAHDMYLAVADAARFVWQAMHSFTIYDHLTDMDEAIKELRKAIDAYELGKELDEERQRRANGFVDRHMTP